MPSPTFSDVVRVAVTMPDSKGRRDLVRILRSAKLEWDEDLRKRLRKQNKDGFVIAGLMGKSVSVHLNKGKPPFFNIKPPKRKGDYGPFGSTIGNVWATLQTGVHFHVASTATVRVVLEGGDKNPYAGPVGKLEAVEMGPNFQPGEYGDVFGVVPDKASIPVEFNPKQRNKAINVGGEYPIVPMSSLFFCVNGNIPISGASAAVCRAWKTTVDSPKKMSDSDQQHFIDAVEKKFGRPFGILDRPGHPDERVASFTQKKGIAPRREGYYDDPRFWNVHSSLVRVAYCHPETRKHLLPLLTE